MHPVAAVIFLAMRPSFALKMQSYVNETSSGWTNSADGLWCGGRDAVTRKNQGNIALKSGWATDVADCKQWCDNWAGCGVVSLTKGTGEVYCEIYAEGTQCSGFRGDGYTMVKSAVTTTTPAPAPPPPPAGAKGDPHLLNIKGERFNVQRQGSAPLVKITSGGDAHLEVMALVEGVKQCQKKMFITQVNSSGSWLEKNVAVIVGEEQSGKSFSVLVDGQEVWSPASTGSVAPATENIIFNHAKKFSIHEISAKAESGIEIKTAYEVKMKIVRPQHRPSTTPHLNFDIDGLRNIQDSFMVGGLLGKDDHSFWTTRNEDCSQQFARTEEHEGSFAVAK